MARTYNGGGTILNRGGGFTTFDPAAKQWPTKKDEKPAAPKPASSKGPKLSFPRISRQLSRNSLFFDVVARLVRGIELPTKFHVAEHVQSEISKFESLELWARSDPRFVAQFEKLSRKKSKTSGSTKMARAMLDAGLFGSMDDTKAYFSNVESERLSQDIAILEAKLDVLRSRLRALNGASKEGRDPIQSSVKPPQP